MAKKQTGFYANAGGYTNKVLALVDPPKTAKRAPASPMQIVQQNKQKTIAQDWMALSQANKDSWSKAAVVKQIWSESNQAMIFVGGFNIYSICASNKITFGSDPLATCTPAVIAKLTAPPTIGGSCRKYGGWYFWCWVSTSCRC